MNNLLKYLFGIFSVLVFLAATTGITVYSHYCSSSEVEETSLFKSLAECEHYTKSSKTIQSKTGKSCCHADSHCEAPQAVKDDCCSNESQFFRVSDDFTTSSEEQWKVNPKEISIANAVLPIDNESIENRNFSIDLITAFHLPPPKSGKQLIVFLQHQKTDPDPIA